MSDYVKEYIDKLISEENYRRMEQQGNNYTPVHPNEVQKLLDEDQTRREYEKSNGR